MLLNMLIMVRIVWQTLVLPMLALEVIKKGLVLVEDTIEN